MILGWKYNFGLAKVIIIDYKIKIIKLINDKIEISLNQQNLIQINKDAF